MEGPTKDNDIEMARGTIAAETMMASSSNNQGESSNSMKLEHYSAAAEGDFEKFKHSDSEALAKILTPNDNTILHIHITARLPPKSSTSQVPEEDFLSEIYKRLWQMTRGRDPPIRANNEARLPQRDVNMNFVTGILGMCPDLLWQANKKGETLLHMAARYGLYNVVKYLLQECEKIPYKNQYGDQEHEITPTRRMLQKKSHEAKDTALHEAVRYSRDDLHVVKELTKADPELTYEANKAGETPLYLAAERGYSKVLDEILKTCTSPADHGPYDRTALHVAVIRKDKDMVKRLLRDGESIHKSKQDRHGWTPLHFAAHLGNIKILNELLSKDNSTAYKADNEGKTALHIAAGCGKVDIMQELIFKCPDCCELVDVRGQNVLHFALESWNRWAVKLVLENPLLENLINEKDENGNTPFLYAASMGNYIPMLDRRMDIQVFNHHNHNAADIVSANRKVEDGNTHFLSVASIGNFFLMLDRREDIQVLNHHKQNFVDILAAKLTDIMLREFPILNMLPYSFSGVLKTCKVNPGLRMIVSKNDNIGERKDEGNTVESKEDGVVEDEGNRMTSKSNNGKGKDISIDNLMKKTEENDLVAATLIATVSFAAGFTVPGGFVADKGLDQGAAILTKNTAFRAFVILNTISMFFSCLAVLKHLIESSATHVPDTRTLFNRMKFRQVLIGYALMAMIGAFLSGTCAVLHSDKNLAISACVVPVAMFTCLLCSHTIKMFA